MKLTTTPTKEDIRRTAEDIAFELQTGLVRGIKISTHDQILAWRHGDSDGEVKILVQERGSTSGGVEVLNAMAYGKENMVQVLAEYLEKSGGKFARFQ